VSRDSLGSPVRDAAWVLASAAGWAFTIGLALYSYYEDGVTGLGLAVAVRTLPAAFAAPLIRSVVGRVRPGGELVWTAAARASVMALLAAAAAADIGFAQVLGLAAFVRIAGAADVPGNARQRQDEIGFLVGGILAGVCLAVAHVHTIFAVCAVAYAVTAVMALASRGDASGPSETDLRTLPLAAALRDRDARRLHVLRAGRAAARSGVELLVVIAAVDLLGMGDDGVGWLCAAWAVGLLAGTPVLRRRVHGASARTVGASCALVGVPLAMLALEPPPLFAFVLLAVLGLGFAGAYRAERVVETRLPTPDLEADDVIDALARTAGAAAAGILVVAVGDTAAVVIAGVVAAVVGLAVLALPERAAELSPEQAA
jgi:hypothetical protein